MRQTIVFLFATVWATAAFAADPNHPTNSYGSAEVTRILRIDDNGTLFCDIRDFPPIIGKNMPVMLKDLKPASSAEANQKIKDFLSNLLMSPSDEPKHILLNNIHRGKAFCLCADIRYGGKDISTLLIEKGLAERIVQVKEPVSSSPVSPVETITPRTSAPPPTQTTAPTQTGYIASKTSKVFHRADCYHVRRMNTEKAVNFATRQEAIETGRRPCKTCNP